MKWCNILRNTQICLSSDGTIRSDGNLTIEYSYILENNANYIFFAMSPYTITLSNCTVDSTSYCGSFTMQSTVTKDFILALNNMLTENCHAEYDSVGTLTVIPFISCPTMKVFWYSCKKKYHAGTSNLFSFICLFIITFIHPNPPVDCCYNCDFFCLQNLIDSV